MSSAAPQMTTGLLMRALVVAAALALFPFASGRAQRGCKGASALVHRDSVSFLLDAPKGWTLDCEAGRNDGPLTVLYRIGESWRGGQAVMYASMLSLEPGADSTISKRIDAEVRDWKQRTGDAVVAREPGIRTTTGVVAPVRRFVSKAHGLHEIAAYIPRGRDMPILAMTACSQAAGAARSAGVLAALDRRCLAPMADGVRRQFRQWHGRLPPGQLPGRASGVQLSFALHIYATLFGELRVP